MAVLQVLAEVVGSIKLLTRVALAEFVHILEMSDAVLQILFAHAHDALVLACPWEFVSTVSTDIDFTGFCRAVVERPLVPRQSRARPAVPSDMQRVLMPFGFVLVLETIPAEGALVLLFGLVDPGTMAMVRHHKRHHVYCKYIR